MGFLKRFFNSMGSKKNKKNKSRANRHEEDAVDSSGRLMRTRTQTLEPWQAPSDDANRLLRSSSAHFAAMDKIDYSSLPPLPHPIHSLATPTSTPARSTNTSIQRRGTYTVTVHERQLHSRTEFPNANPPLHDSSPSPSPLPRATNTMSKSTPNLSLSTSPVHSRSHPNPRAVPFTPHDNNRLHNLRQDPSVASLLYMYDSNGRISSNAFSNTPPTPAPIYSSNDEGRDSSEGRAQKKRNGSTLRELMGDPDRDVEDWGTHTRNYSTVEGDISWAERFLGEHAASSTSLVTTASTSSLALQTPKEVEDTNAYHKTSGKITSNRNDKHAITNTTFSSDPSHSSDTNYPIISSMEVELSGSTSVGVVLDINNTEDVDWDEGDAHVIDEDRERSQYPYPYSVAVNPKTPQRASTISREPQTQRASEVFGFLTERRKSIRERERQQQLVESDRALPALPISISPSSSMDNLLLSAPVNNNHGSNSASPSTTSTSRSHSTQSSPGNASHTSDDTSESSAQAQIHTATLTKLRAVVNPLSRSTDQLNAMSSPGCEAQLTGASTGTNVSKSTTSSNVHPSRIPRGPRPPSQSTGASSSRADLANPSEVSLPLQYQDTASTSASTSTKPPTSQIPQRTRRDTSTAASSIPVYSGKSANAQAPTQPADEIDPFTPIPRSYSRQHRRLASQASIASLLSADDEDDMKTPAASSRNANTRGRNINQEVKEDKENSPSPNPPHRTYMNHNIPQSYLATSSYPISAYPTPSTLTSDSPKTPKTPINSSAARSIFDIRHPNYNYNFGVKPGVSGEVPSPASSSELSPLGRDIMMNLRQRVKGSMGMGNREGTKLR